MTNSIDFSTATSRQIMHALCKRIESIRLSRNWTREKLAEEAGVSPRTIANLEEGKGVTLDTLIRVMIAMKIQGSLETLLPDPSIRPMERIRPGNSERRRARPHKNEVSQKWSWGTDETDKA